MKQYFLTELFWWKIYIRKNWTFLANQIIYLAESNTLNYIRKLINYNQIKCQTLKLQEKEEKDMERLEPRDSKRTRRKSSLVSPSPLSEDSPEEEELRESHPSSMMKPELSWDLSLTTSSEMPLHTLSTPEERPSLLWMSSMLLRDKEDPSTDLDNNSLELTFNINLIKINKK